jgi:excisionase family DNA binding protein
VPLQGACIGIDRAWERQDTASERSGITHMMEPNPQVPHNSEHEELLTPSEVAAMFRVNPKTVTRWARSGKISAIRTLGGHRRFRKSEITRILAEGGQNHG